MNAMELLETRASNSKLTEPAPDEAALHRLLTAALRAPDHSLLRPWRVFVVRGERRDALGDVLVDAQRRRDPACLPDELEKLRKKPLRAPLILVVAACPRPHPKVPEIEQVMSAAALAQNLLLGLHALGFAGIWRTGTPAYDPYVKQAFGLAPHDSIVGFLYAGTPKQAVPSIQRPDAADFVTSW